MSTPERGWTVVGALLDASAVHPGRTRRTHLRILADTIGAPAARVDELLEQVDLADSASAASGPQCATPPPRSPAPT